MNLTDSKILVIGGTSGIGLAVVSALAARGTRLVAISRDPSKAAGALPAGVQTRACDIRDRDALAALFAAEAPFDGLVNAATGGERALGPFLKMDLDGYQASFDKLWGYTNSVRLGTDHLAENGAIVLVSGSPARRGRGQTALASVGGAVEAFVRTVAQEIVPRRINVVSPGVIETPMFGPASEQRSKMLAASTANHLIPRPGTADEVAGAIVFALENEFVTGTTIDVDGGWLLR